MCGQLTLNRAQLQANFLLNLVSGISIKRLAG